MLKPSYNYEELEVEVNTTKNSSRSLMIYTAGMISCCIFIILAIVLYAKAGTHTSIHEEKMFNYTLDDLYDAAEKEVHGCNRTFRMLTSKECIKYYNDRKRRIMYEDDDDVGCGESDANVPIGQICEGDGECGTNDHLNNCNIWDVYVRIKY